MVCLSWFLLPPVDLNSCFLFQKCWSRNTVLLMNFFQTLDYWSCLRVLLESLLHLESRIPDVMQGNTSLFLATVLVQVHNNVTKIWVLLPNLIRLILNQHCLQSLKLVTSLQLYFGVFRYTTSALSYWTLLFLRIFNLFPKVYIYCCSRWTVSISWICI